MTVESLATPYGRSALDALRRLVAAGKADDPLASVTVLVPNNIAGLFVRRRLAHGLADGHPGIAGVFISTLARLAEQLAAASLHPRTPATATVVAAAWRSVLADSPGVFASVADHPATIRALTAAHGELRDLSDAGLDAVASAGPLHVSLIDLHRTATARVARTWYDQTDLLTEAARLIPDRPAQANRWGRIVLYLPQRLTHAELRFARTLAAHAEVTVLAGLTGDQRADAAVRGLRRGPRSPPGAGD